VGCKGEAFSLLLIEGWDWDPARGAVRIIKSERPAAGKQRKRKIEMSTERHWEGHGRAGIPGPRLGDTQPTGRGSAESLGCCDWMDSRQRRDVICASESVIPKPGSPPRPLPLSLFLRLLAAGRRSSCRPNTHDASSAPVDHAPSVPVSPKVADPAPASRLILHSGRNRRRRSPRLAITNGCTAPNQR
jgi:hypothetical protein